MALTPQQESAIISNLQKMGKEKALEYIKTWSDKLKSNPDVAKQIWALYATAFTGVKTNTNGLINTGNKTNTGGTNTGGTNTGGTNTGGTTTPPSTTPTTLPWAFSNTSAYTYDHTKDIGAVPWSPTPPAFTPTKLIWGVAVNESWASVQQKYGFIQEQADFLAKLDKQNINKGMGIVERRAAATKAMQELQKLNTNKDTFWKLPTEFQDTVWDLVDLNNNGVPDSQEGYGLDAKSGENFTMTDDLTNLVFSTDQNFSQNEKNLTQFETKMLDIEKAATAKAADARTKLLDDTSRQLVAEYDGQISDIKWLLDERLQLNKDQYENAVGSVYRVLWGQIKGLQRIIGTDGKAMDDATALSLMGEKWVDAMQSVIDLKNTLVGDYLNQKETAIEKIRTLAREKILAAEDASEAINAINAQADLDVINLTKGFYQKMFGMTSADDARTETNLSNSRSAVTSYLSALGQTPLQINQIINNYVQKWYSVEDAMQKVSEDIRDGTNPVINDITKNNADAAKAAQAKFEQDMRMKIEPIITKWDVDLQLQNDKQAFEEAQNALDRQLELKKISISWAKSGWGSKALSITELTKRNGSLVSVLKESGKSWQLPSNMTEADARLFDSAAVLLTTQPDNTYAQAVIKKYVPEGMDDADATKYIETVSKIQ